MILKDIEENLVPNGGGNTRCIVWDNMLLRKTPYVTTIIQDWMIPNHFFSADCPPY